MCVVLMRVRHRRDVYFMRIITL